mmetsp:Transcript_4963/g.14938  ORF Transcript_4963/g.14938 Transcript_4963/m.14938 type:complete len:218 (+) Transcript_4963:596-1249(+)
MLAGFVPAVGMRGGRGRAVVVCQDPTVAPNFARGWVPEKDKDYTEVRVLTISRRVNYKEDLCPTSLISLAPVKLYKKALKMTLSGAQVESIKTALAGQKEKASRPSTQDLFMKVIRANGGIVSKCAITHIQNELYFARVWIRTGYRTVDIDARPSDAIAVAIQCQAPLFLNKKLLIKWGVPIKAIAKEVDSGNAFIAKYHSSAKTSTMIGRCTPSTL